MTVPSVVSSPLVAAVVEDRPSMTPARRCAACRLQGGAFASGTGQRTDKRQPAPHRRHHTHGLQRLTLLYRLRGDHRTRKSRAVAASVRRDRTWGHGLPAATAEPSAGIVDHEWRISVENFCASLRLNAVCKWLGQRFGHQPGSARKQIERDEQGEHSEHQDVDSSQHRKHWANMPCFW